MRSGRQPHAPSRRDKTNVTPETTWRLFRVVQCQIRAIVRVTTIRGSAGPTVLASVCRAAVAAQSVPARAVRAMVIFHIAAPVCLGRAVAASLESRAAPHVALARSGSGAAASGRQIIRATNAPLVPASLVLPKARGPLTEWGHAEPARHAPHPMGTM
jgi:hypothetical protein